MILENPFTTTELFLLATKNASISTKERWKKSQTLTEFARVFRLWKNHSIKIYLFKNHKILPIIIKSTWNMAKQFSLQLEKINIFFRLNKQLFYLFTDFKVFNKFVKVNFFYANNTLFLFAFQYLIFFWRNIFFIHQWV